MKRNGEWVDCVREDDLVGYLGKEFQSDCYQPHNFESIVGLNEVLKN
jgi:hypothetical protein